MNLRPYQVTALEAIWTALQCEPSVLLEAACSAGKTLLFSKITQRLLAENPGFRVLILMDREVLVQQTHAKLLTIAPELGLSVGVVCASVSDTKTLHKPITIASRQSLIGQLSKFEPVHLIIVDEAHCLAMPREGQSEPPDQFGAIIGTLREYNPRTRLLGVTATPYRLNDGYIYGTKNSPGSLPYFAEVHHKITVGELQSAGYLCPLVGKVKVSDYLSKELSSASLVDGEYNLGVISGIMSEGRHITSAVQTWKEYASNRKKTVVFCVTIEHAEKLTAAFNAEGIRALAIHSEQDDIEARANMQALHDGDGEVFCSVAKLTTGMDVVDIDCLLLCRPTKSAALYKQILGRGQRIAEGKEDCLVLDMVGNANEFGTDLDRLKIRYKKSLSADGKAVSKECPNCNADIHPACRVCPECGYEYPATDFIEAEKPEMKDAEYGSLPPVEMPVNEWYLSIQTSKKTAKKMLRIRMELDDGLRGVTTNIFLFFPGDGYTGYAVEKGKAIWHELTTSRDYPDTAEEAIEIEPFLCKPASAVVDLSGRWPEVKELKFEDVPF